jgi:hypothetical protein
MVAPNWIRESVRTSINQIAPNISTEMKPAFNLYFFFGDYVFDEQTKGTA